MTGTMSSSLVHCQVQKQVLDGLQKGNDALEKANAVFSLDEIESIMSDTEDAVEKQREIERMLSGGLTEVKRFTIIVLWRFFILCILLSNLFQVMKYELL